MASSIPNFLLITAILFPPTFSLSTSTTSLNSITSLCKSTPYPDVCFNSLKLSVSININPTIINYFLQTLNLAITEAEKLFQLFASASHSNNIIEKQKGSIQECKQLHQITLTSLQKSVTKIHAGDSHKLADARAYLSAALTNKNTCLEGLESANGPMKSLLVNSMISTYKHVSNSLSMLPKPSQTGRKNRRRLLGFPTWLSRKDRRILQSSDDEYNLRNVITVAADGTGNFTSIGGAINVAPNNSYGDRVVIYVREGVYAENVEIPINKPNIVLIGDGSDVTVITGSRSVVDGWTTYGSATLAVSGEGFLARDITIENTAGAEKHQAVALRVNADFAALYRCKFTGYQDTLYVHSFRQFYRECEISGTLDFIFGNAAVVFQASRITARLPLPGQFIAITAQSRDSPDEDTGISIQNCSIKATEELEMNVMKVKSYLGRPWRVYSRTVFIECGIDGFVDPRGWIEWPGNEGLDTLYYGEFENYGYGSRTGERVQWGGFHVMGYDEAYNFTVSEFITGEEWLDSTSFPYNYGI